MAAISAHVSRFTCIGRLTLSDIRKIRETKRLWICRRNSGNLGSDCIGRSFLGMGMEVQSLKRNLLTEVGSQVNEMPLMGLKLPAN